MRATVSVAVLAWLIAGACQAETLPGALEAAYRNNPTLRAARESADATAEGSAQAWSRFLPSVSISGSSGTTREETRRGAFPMQRARREPDSEQIAVQQDVFTGGRRIYQVNVANAQTEAARQQLRATEQVVMLRVVAAYLDVIRDEEIVNIQQENVDGLMIQRRGAQQRFNEGDGTRTDIAQSEARLSAAQSGLAAAMATAASTRAVYVQIVGEVPTALQEAPPAPAVPPTLDDAVAQALYYNPDLRGFVEAERAARNQVGVERAARFPQVSIVARQVNSADADNTLGAQIDRNIVALEFSMPLFEGGFINSRVRQSQSNARRADAETDEARRAIVANVSTAWNRLTAARTVVSASQTQLAAARFALEGVREEQREGVRDTIDVLNAQQELLEARLAVARADRDLYVAAHQLLQTMGRLDAETMGLDPAGVANERGR